MISVYRPKMLVLMTLEDKNNIPRHKAGIFFRTATILLFVGGMVCSCAKPNKLVEIKGEAQGTFYSIKYLSEEANPPLNKFYFDNLFASIDSSLSIYKPYSLVNKFNDGDSILTNDPWFIQMVLQSDKVYHESNGAFDPSVVHLVNAWGFGPDSKSYGADVPIDSLLRISGWDKVDFEILSDGRMLIKKKVKGIKIEFNAIAQGYASDIIAERLEQSNIKDYLIDAGGELRASGFNQNGEIWKIGIDKPVALQYSREIVAVIPLENASVATSGSYRKYYEVDGVKYSHAISPKTGRPVDHSLLSVTVITDSCSLADAYATAIMIMGLDEGKEFLIDHPEIDAYLVYSDPSGELQSYTTQGIKEALKEL
ncbi:MAG: FAD:protein FMN transferase [Bacteroidetes bacterium]|nr:MAG: FAD:protein FMN transferase [Bacteroidota bacterium]